MSDYALPLALVFLALMHVAAVFAVLADRRARARGICTHCRRPLDPGELNPCDPCWEAQFTW